MSNGRVSAFIGLYRAILADIADYQPTLIAGMSRDLIRLTSLSENMGERVFTLMLPALGKIFDQALDAGSLHRSGLPLARSINTRTNIPRLFQGIWLEIFELDGCLRENIDPNMVFYLRTLYLACKKYRSDCAPKAVYATVKEYYDVDEQLPPPSHVWDGDGNHLLSSDLGTVSDLVNKNDDLFGIHEEDMSSALACVQSIADRVALVIGDYVPGDYRFKHGPGAVSDNRTGRGYKYAFPAWSPRLQHVFPADVFAVANYSACGSGWDEFAGIPPLEGASKLCAVPKTQKGPRLIAAEPTCNQWCQQNVLHFLKDRIRATFIGRSIDFSRQDLSGSAALVASRNKLFATVDLSAASDRLSCWLVQRMFRSNLPLLAAMIASRTRFIRNEIDVKSPKLHKLRKFASMGSALTFPVQSLVFYAICVGAGMSLAQNKGKKAEDLARLVRVYGDDLIVPVAWLPRVECLLEALHLKVNRQKTFAKGNFRESCGTDAFMGFEVTPCQVLAFYSESQPSTLVSTVDTSNNLFKKGLWKASRWLLSTMPSNVVRLLDTVRMGSGSFGLETFTGGSEPSAVKRWNSDLQYWERKIFVLRNKAKSSIRHEGFANLLQYFTEDPSRSILSDWESGMVARPTTVLGRGWVRDEITYSPPR